MQTSLYKTFPLVIVALSACGPAPSSHSSRLDGAPLNFVAQPVEMDAQVTALTEYAQRIVVKSTVNGAALNAALGCGISVVTSGNASGCLTAAAFGGATGAVSGHIKGKRTVSRQVEKISPSAVVRTLRKTNAQMTLVQSSLPARLAEQEAALSDLEVQRATGAINTAKYNTARASIA